MDTGISVVLVTAPQGEAGQNIARTLVEEGFAACVNRIPGIQSTYTWEGKICDDSEELLVIKTASENVDRLINKVKEIHPYDVPEIIALPVFKGSEDYIKWVLNTKGI